MELVLPARSLVLMIGISGSGKSRFAARHFKPTQIVSSDACRAMIADDENFQPASGDAFELMYFIADKRLARGRLTVIDATNVRTDARRPFLEIAQQYKRPVSVVVLDLPVEVCRERNKKRGRVVPDEVISRQHEFLKKALDRLPAEGYEYIHVINTPSRLSRAKVKIV